MPTITAPCTLDTCPLDWALVRYRPSLPGNALYLALFLIMLLIQIYQGFRSRIWSYLACMTCGLVLEVVGYGGRLMLHSNPFNFSSFLQSVALRQSFTGHRATLMQLGTSSVSPSDQPLSLQPSICVLEG